MSVVNHASMQNESCTLKLFYHHIPASKTCCVSCITLIYISCMIYHYMTLYNHTTVEQKFFELVVIEQLTLSSLELLMQLNQLALRLYSCYNSWPIVMHHIILSYYYLTIETMIINTIITRGYGQTEEPTDRLTDKQSLLPTELI